MSPEINPESSTRYARDTTRAEWLWRIVAIAQIGALLAMPMGVVADEPAPESTISFDIPQQRADLALTQFAEQANLTLLFPFDGVRDRTANALTGEYTLDEAIEVLLAGTGLTPTFKNALVLDIAIDSDPTKDEDSMNTKNKAGVVAVLAGVLAGGVQAQEPTVTETEIQTSVVTGTVTDARTGANLRGAKITIEETGQWTSTGELGRFRFVSVPEGEFTLTVSFLGYARQSATVGVRGSSVAQNFALRGGTEIEEIVVFGQRSARAQALNQERTAENLTTVVSSDLLGQFEGATLAEALRRAPGISFQESSITGDGTNVIVRGLAPDLNQIRFDGVRLAEGTGTGRSPSIGNLLTDAVSEVTVSKTLLPSQDSAGSGGLIEIKTRGPLDRKKRFFSASIEALTNDGFQEAVQLGGTASGTFGENDDFGMSLTVQYRDLSNTTVGYGRGYSALGQYLPLDDNGNPVLNPFLFNPLMPFPFEDGVDEVFPGQLSSNLNEIDTETLSGTFVAQWRPADNTELRLAFTQSELDTSSNTSSVEFGVENRYVAIPIDELDGEIRGALLWENAFSNIGFDGSFIQVSHDNKFFDTKQDTQVFSIVGNTTEGGWRFDYGIGRSKATNSADAYSWAYGSPGNLIPGLALFNVPTEFIDENGVYSRRDGLIISPFAPVSGADYVLPQFSQAGFDYYNDPTNYLVSPLASDNIVISRSSGENTRDSGFLDIRYDFQNTWIEYVQIGFEYEESRFDTDADPQTSYAALNNLSLGELGFSSFDQNNLAAIGVNAGFFGLRAAEVESFFRNIDSLSQGNNAVLSKTVSERSSVFDPGTFTEEQELAGYLQAKINLRNVEIIGGFRSTNVDVKARTLTSPTLIREDGTPDPVFGAEYRELIDQEASQREILPRIAVNYRPTDELVVRLGYFQSIARPNVRDLSGRQSVFLDLQPVYGPDGDRPFLLVSQGNPDLKPTVSNNFDLSAQLYSQSGGVLGVSFFYKEFENFLEFSSTSSTSQPSNLTLPSDPRFQSLPSDIFVQVTQPVNNDEDAKIWGFEVSAEHQFVTWPGWLSGFGIFANYTYSESEKFFIFEDVFNSVTGEFEDVEIADVPFDQSPEHSGTFAITYSMYGVDASLAYSAQSERLRSFRPNNLSAYNDSDDSLDARFEYRFDWNGTEWRAFVAGSDLLKGSGDPDVLEYIGGNGSPKYYTDGTFFGGRTISIGLSAWF